MIHFQELKRRNLLLEKTKMQLLNLMKTIQLMKASSEDESIKIENNAKQLFCTTIWDGKAQHQLFSSNHFLKSRGN